MHRFNRFRRSIPFILVLYSALFTPGCSERAREVERPEPVRSKRVVVYDAASYDRLAGEWRAYYDAYPSEDAYANWMYAARYAGHEDYRENLEKGLKRYPANPTLLYLSGMAGRGEVGDESVKLGT